MAGTHPFPVISSEAPPQTVEKSHVDLAPPR